LNRVFSEPADDALSETLAAFLSEILKGKLDDVVSEGVLDDSIEVHEQRVQKPFFEFLQETLVDRLLALLDFTEHLLENADRIFVDRKSEEMLSCD
jgi:hypothetical protein